MTPSEIKIVGVAGGSGSGKTTFARFLQTQLGPAECVILSQDCYYIDQSARFHGDGEDVNFDHPDALDFPLIVEHLRALRQGVSIEVPVYDLVTHKRVPHTEPMAPFPVVILEGTLILSQLKICALLTASIFIDAPEEIRLQRRLKRDSAERGRSKSGILKQFELQVAPMHDEFVEPSKKRATHIVSGVEPFDGRMTEWCDLFRSSGYRP